MSNKISDFLYSFKDVALLVTLTLLKTGILYKFTNIENLGLIFIRTIPPLVVIYGILNLINSKRRRIYILSAYIIISLILFGDLMYYQHFSFLPSARALFLLGVVPAVVDSVVFILKPINVLMLIDIIPLIIYFKRTKEKVKPVNEGHKKLNRHLVIGMLLIVILRMMFIDGNSIYAYSNYGVYDYHIYEIYEIFSNKDTSTYVSIDDEDILNEEFLRYIREKNNIKEKKYFGIGKNKNIIVIQFESLQNFVINSKYEGKEITPNLNKLIKNNSIYFDNYYQQVGPGNTSDAEFTIHNSMYPTSEKAVYKEYNENEFYTLPHVLKDRGYSTKAFHGYKGDFWNREEMYPRLGIDDFISLEDYKRTEVIGLGISDESFYNQSIDILKEMKNPYYAFMITLTSHNPYEIPEEKWGLKLRDEHIDTLFGNYIQSVHYADMALGKFIKDLQTKGLYDDTITIIYGDHSGLYPNRLGNKDIVTKFLGKEYNYQESLNVPLIFHIPNSGINDINHIVGSHIDFTPTLLNLIGINDHKMILFGQDLNNSSEGFVPIQYHLPKGSFIDDNKMFIMSSDGVFENSKAWNLKTGKSIELKEAVKGYERAIKDIDKSYYILEHNLIPKLLEKINE